MENSKFKVQKQVIENNELDEYFLRNFIQHFILRDMPTILRIGSFRFHFYSDEYNEPSHIHVATTEGECKFRLDAVK